MDRWRKKQKKRRFFDEKTGQDSSGVKYDAFVQQSAGSGFKVDPDTGLVQVSGSAPLSSQYMRYRSVQDQARRTGTTENRLWMKERSEMLDFMNANGSFFTRPAAGGGTELLWEGYDHRGRHTTRPLRVAVSRESGLRARDFGSNTPGMFGVELKDDIFSDNFAKYFKVLTGGQSVVAPTPADQEAVDYKDKLEEAARRMRITAPAQSTSPEPVSPSAPAFGSGYKEGV